MVFEIPGCIFNWQCMYEWMNVMKNLKKIIFDVQSLDYNDFGYNESQISHYQTVDFFGFLNKKDSSLENINDNLCQNLKEMEIQFDEHITTNNVSIVIPDIIETLIIKCEVNSKGNVAFTFKNSLEIYLFLFFCCEFAQPTCCLQFPVFLFCFGLEFLFHYRNAYYRVHDSIVAVMVALWCMHYVFVFRVLYYMAYTIV